MPRPKRLVQATKEETFSPPDVLPPQHTVARVVSSVGNNIFTVADPSGETFIVELADRFRSTVWVRRGGYVLIDRAAMGERENKLGGEIVNVVVDEKAWRKTAYWPTEFKPLLNGGKDDEDGFNIGNQQGSNVGKMPPADSDDD